MSETRHALTAGRLVPLQQNRKSLHPQRREREEGSGTRALDRRRQLGDHRAARTTAAEGWFCAPNIILERAFWQRVLAGVWALASIVFFQLFIVQTLTEATATESGAPGARHRE